MVVTRFAPSPTTVPNEQGIHTGLHLGGARTALFSFLHAKSKGGKFLIRIEDTDKARSTKESEEAILESLRWIGIESDVLIVRQSERDDIYQCFIDQLLESGHAYKCFCTSEEIDKMREAQKAVGEKPKYDRLCWGLDHSDKEGKPYVVRLFVPEGITEWEDEVLGRIKVNNKELSDPVLQRSDGSFCFLFVNMLDDALQGVTHVVRGQDGVSHCHSQIILCKALGFEPPTYAHIPFVLGDDKQKLSKRNGSASILELRDKGYLREAVVNALARLGCSYGEKGEKEILSMEELKELFRLHRVNSAPAVFDPKKLDSLGLHYIKAADDATLASALIKRLFDAGVPAAELAKLNILAVITSLRNRCKTTSEMSEQALFYYKGDFSIDHIVASGQKEQMRPILRKCAEKLNECEFKEEQEIAIALASAGEELGMKFKEVGPVLRLALAGSLSAPGIYDMLLILGKTESLHRLDRI